MEQTTSHEANNSIHCRSIGLEIIHHKHRFYKCPIIFTDLEKVAE